MYRLNDPSGKNVDDAIATEFFRQFFRQFFRPAAAGAQHGRAVASTPVQFAYGVFDVLAQEVALFGRHVAIAATLIEVGRHAGRAHGGI
jgi:hypothetical protein